MSAVGKERGPNSSFRSREDDMTKATLLVVEDDPLQRRLVRENLEAAGYAVLEASDREEALAQSRRRPPEIAVVDYKLGQDTGTAVVRALLAQDPLVTPIMVTAFGNIERAVEAIREGAYDYIVKPINFDNFLLVIERALERQTLRKEISELRNDLEEKYSSKSFVVVSARMEEVARLISRAASSDATVLLSGETGTGKDLAAKAVHYSSKRKTGPYMAVNIPSLPETLIESELFGAEKGAYTGADERKTGRFEAAHGGTLLLDEIGDLPVHLQVKLLRFLQDREFYRLGSSKPLRSDVRIIAATNKNLEKLVREERFRADLYYRLNVIRIEIPPLRARREDIPPLVDLFIKRYGEREGKTIASISREAMSSLLAYPFPGNIRELENIVERAVVFSRGETIVEADLPVFLREKSEDVADDGLPLTEKVRRLETHEIRRVLRETGGVKSRAARALGITERMLSYKMKSCGID
jgi:two-component system, NtrC family, response regulator AtoC